MTTLAIDFSYDNIDPVATAKAGYVGMLEYLSPTPAKNATPGRIAADHAAGLGVALIFESTGTEALGGELAGYSNAMIANGQADALGAPAGSVILANVGDFAATSVQIAAIAAYYNAFDEVVHGHSTSRAAGGYGTRYIIEQLVALGHEGYWWQNAMDDEGEPGDEVSPYATLYQRVTPTRVIDGYSGGWDEDVVLAPFPWWHSGQTPMPTPPLKPPAPNHGPDGNPWCPMEVNGMFLPPVCCALQWSLNHTGANPVLETNGLFTAGTVRALQLRLNAVDGPVTADGVVGPQTIKAMQRHTGAAQDGVWGPVTTEALQRTLNAGTF